MEKGKFILVQVDELEDKLAEYYSGYNDVCVYPNLHGILIMDWEYEDGESYRTELTPHVTGLKQVVHDCYNFDFDNYVIVDDNWVYFLKKDGRREE